MNYNFEYNDAPASAQTGASQDESWTDKALREVQLIEAGFSGFGQAAQDAFNSKNLPETATNVVISATLAFAMARFAPVEGLEALCNAAAIGSSISFLGLLGDNSTKIVDTMRDTWNSDENWNKNVQIMQSSLGKFGFDTVLMSAAAFGGSKAGAELFNAPSLVRNLPPPMEKESSFKLSKYLPQFTDLTTGPSIKENPILAPFASLKKQLPASEF